MGGPSALPAFSHPASSKGLHRSAHQVMYQQKLTIEEALQQANGILLEDRSYLELNDEKVPINSKQLKELMKTTQMDRLSRFKVLQVTSDFSGIINVLAAYAGKKITTLSLHFTPGFYGLWLPLQNFVNLQHLTLERGVLWIDHADMLKVLKNFPKLERLSLRNIEFMRDIGTYDGDKKSSEEFRFHHLKKLIISVGIPTTLYLMDHLKAPNLARRSVTIEVPPSRPPNTNTSFQDTMMAAMYLRDGQNLSITPVILSPMVGEHDHPKGTAYTIMHTISPQHKDPYPFNLVSEVNFFWRSKWEGSDSEPMLVSVLALVLKTTGGQIFPSAEWISDDKGRTFKALDESIKQAANIIKPGRGV
ncbi:hypothetical protein FA95DRAFT_1610111 [Auriscalpium vulgare]|uniref:Uncharacterized protein n=1 Tax=Auriscalpium vulgare TaxID=40419 RepID=A0ACB8RFA6_9AGAM|nr:hypothetical protein FA95DRAFT_1610111 [Auriscalpium vulgare]